MNYIFGQKLEKLEPQGILKIFSEANEKKYRLQSYSLNEIIDCLDGFSQEWTAHPEWKEKALLHLTEVLAFSPKMIADTIDILPALFQREYLTQRFKGEVGDQLILDQWCFAKSGIGKIKAYPLGELLHVTAGNVFISFLDSLIMGFLTKNISYLKLSSKNQTFPFYFAELFSLYDKKNILADKFCLLSWKGGDDGFERLFKTRVQGIVAWGGEEMLTSYQKDLPLGVKLFDYGPKISFHLITKKALHRDGIEVTAEKIAKDVMMWDQQACSSPQNIFYEEGIDLSLLLIKVGSYLKNAIYPRGKLSADEAVEIYKEKEKAHYQQVMDGSFYEIGADYLLLEDRTPYLRASALNRTVVAKKFTNIKDLIDQISPFRFYLQSCGYALASNEKDLYLHHLAQAGVKRFSPLGKMSEGYPGLPHDGKYGLSEFIYYVTDEILQDEERLIEHVKKNVSYFSKENAEKIDDIALTSSSHFQEHSYPETKELINQEITGARVFASGGSTGKPKHIVYSNQDWSRTAEAFARHFKKVGPKSGDVVANLFASGSLYSSFLAVDRYLEELNVIQLPISGLGQISEVVRLLNIHQPSVVMGLPSLIMSYAEYCEHHQIKLTIPKIYFAGEHFSLVSQKYLTNVWKTTSFVSAGYATVDAGMIGYQCPHCLFGEHHVLEDIKLEIINEQIVVTSFLREAMPVIRYQTGDRGEWVDGLCPGETNSKFRLLGRTDEQINLWASRIFLGDLEKAIASYFTFLPEYQIEIKPGAPFDFFNITLHVEEEFDASTLTKMFYEGAKDLRQTMTFEIVLKNISWQKKEITDFEKNLRTGKIKRVLDRRV